MWLYPVWNSDIYIYNYSLTFPLLNRNCCLLVVLRMYTTSFTELEILKPFQWNYGRLVNLFDVCWSEFTFQHHYAKPKDQTCLWSLVASFPFTSTYECDIIWKLYYGIIFSSLNTINSSSFTFIKLLRLTKAKCWDLSPAIRFKSDVKFSLILRKMSSMTMHMYLTFKYFSPSILFYWLVDTKVLFDSLYLT